MTTGTKRKKPASKKADYDESLITPAVIAIAKRLENMPDNVVYPNGFMPRPIHIPPYTSGDIGTMLAADYDLAQLQKEASRDGWSAATMKNVMQASKSFESVKLRMLYLPTIVSLGGKEIEWDSHEGRSIQTYQHVKGIAAGLIGISGVAGGGDGAMSIAQHRHGQGIEIAKRSGYKRLFAKAGVAAVLLAIKEETPNPYITPGWMVIPTRSLAIRKARLYSLGFPMLADYVDGGDATLDELISHKTLAKQTMHEQLDTPYKHVQPDMLFVDAPREDPNVPQCWDAFLSGYEHMMVSGKPERRKRKLAEAKKLRENHRVVAAGDLDAAMDATKRAFELMEPKATSVYGAGFVETWELNNDVDFWSVVEDLSKDSFELQA